MQNWSLSSSTFTNNFQKFLANNFFSVLFPQLFQRIWNHYQRKILHILDTDVTNPTVYNRSIYKYNLIDVYKYNLIDACIKVLCREGFLFLPCNN